MEERIGYVHSLESFGSADGPGVRYIIFLSGCNMRCQFCHNPDTWDIKAGKEYTASQLLKTANRYRPYWGSEGGITVSGGEPLLQIDFLLELFEKAKEMGADALAITGNIDFYGKSGFVPAKTKGVRYADDPEADYFLIKELTPGFLDGISGTYKDPEGYFVCEKNPEAFEQFEATFPKKEKLKLPGQLF